MRDIKFRVWDGEDMISPDYITREGFAHWQSNSIPNISDVLMQSTGLKTADTNNEIYEGDILERQDMRQKDKKRTRHVVTFQTNSLRGTSGFDLPQPLHKFEIIGNIYENPGLVENG